MSTMIKNPEQKRVVKKVFLILFVLGLIGIGYWFFFLRGSVSTDDAYVNGYTVNLNAEVSAMTTAFYVNNSDFVKKGDLLIELNPTDYQLKFEKAKNDLALAVRQVVQLKEEVSQNKAQVISSKLRYRKALLDYENRAGLVDHLAITKEDYEHAKIAVEFERAQLNVFQHRLESSKALLGTTSLENHPIVKNAKQRLKLAYLDLKRTKIYAPVDGFVAKRNSDVGSFVTPNTPLLAIISLNDLWVDANFKETQIEGIRIGQPVELISDVYGREVPFTGKVYGLVPGTGSAFSLLPPQNATGNWIKIVQRVPVRILIDQEQIKKNPLLLGLSMNVTVDIQDRSLPILREVNPQKPVVSTDIYQISKNEIKELIRQIIDENKL